MHHVLIVAADVGQREVIRKGLELHLGPRWPTTQSALVLKIDTCAERESALDLLRARVSEPSGTHYEVLIVDIGGFSPPELRLLIGTARSLFTRIRVMILGDRNDDGLLELARSTGAHRALRKPWSTPMLASIVGLWLRGSGGPGPPSSKRT